MASNTTNSVQEQAQVVAQDPKEDLRSTLKEISVHVQNLESTINKKLEKDELEDIYDPGTRKPEEDGVLRVDPKPKKGVVSMLIDTLVHICVKLYHGPIEKSAFLKGNFGPVHKETYPPANLRIIQGELPCSLDGMFIRNGPNPQFNPAAKYVWFDGDGMLHAVRIKDKKATYVSRYVETSRLIQERYFGKAQLSKYGDWYGMFGFFTIFVQALKARAGVYDMSYGWGSANESLIYHHGKLMALEDFDRPYVVKILENGDLETRGINNFKNKLKHNLSPHSKIDPETGELFTFGISYHKPYVTYRIVTPEGHMNDPVHIDVPGPTYMHDFAITKQYVIFMDLPFNFSPQDMMKNNEWIFSFDDTKKSRYGILDRYAKNDKEIKWFDLENGYVFHTANAWEEGEEVVLITCRLEMKPSKDNKKPAPSMFIGTSSNSPYFALPELYEMRFNMTTDKASQKKLSSTFVEHPKVNERYIGRTLRYVYACHYDNDYQIPTIVKFDLQGPETREMKLNLGPKRFGSEVVFVPNQQGDSTKEDDGYLIFYVHDENNGKSFFYVIDAQTMDEKPVAVVELPERVPSGFHSIFITEKQLQEQR